MGTTTTMRWTRPEPGRYTAGPYTVSRSPSGGWHAAGPGCQPEAGWPLLADAKAACAEAALLRLDDPHVAPVVGDIVVTDVDRQGRITAIFPTPGGQVYCIKLPRGRRVCLSRAEFAVVSA